MKLLGVRNTRGSSRVVHRAFTIAELLITLFIAGAFLTAGYQMYSAIVNDSVKSRAEAKATNVAYEYLRRYSAVAVAPCVASTPLNNSSITVPTLNSVTVTVAITCPYTSPNTVSEVTVTVKYNTPQAQVVYATYIKV